MKLFDYLKTVLKKQNCDYLYVNHTNEFFSEYVDVSKSSRYLLTGFSGSTGDAIVSKDNIYLFVDSRYWEQADIEVDKRFVKVVKLDLNYGFNNAIKTLIKQNSKILFYDKKTSFSLIEKFEKMGYELKQTNIDYVADYNNLKPQILKPDFEDIPLNISGKTEQQKIQKLQNKLKDNEVLIISSLEDVSYLLNKKSNLFEYSSVIYGKIVVTKDNYRYFDDEKAFENEIKRLSSNKTYKYLIDKNTLSIKYKKYFAAFEQAKILSTLRSVKYNAEIKHMQSCFERTDRVLESVYKEILKNQYTEKELYDFVNQKFVEYGADKNSFKTILASGKNSSIVHFSHPTERKIDNGDFILLDCGGFYEGGYATDITRTFIFGKSSDEQKLIYTIVLKAFLNAYNANLSIYKTCFQIDEIARNMINKLVKKYNLSGFTFGHGLGHSVGRCVHDGLPTVSPSPLAKMKIKRNLVFTIEPGLYKPDWGGVRLENTIHVVSENKKLRFKSFSKAPFQKSLIDFSILTNKEKMYLKEWNLV